VDPLSRARLWDAIREQSDGGVAVLVTTHYMEEAQQCDRLVLMAAGRIAAQGSLGEIIAGRSVVEVTTASWSDAFAALSAAGFQVMLAGRRVRVGDAADAAVRAVLDESGLDAQLSIAPASLDETMVAVADGTHGRSGRGCRPSD
jgi:ABC-type multidrug transport system ATPase subunit